MHKTIKLAALGLALATAGTSLSAAPYGVMLKASNIKAARFYDVETVSRAGNEVRVWIKVINNPEFQENEIASLMMHMALNCKAHTMQSLATLAYNADGTLFHDLREPQPAQGVVPGTLGAQLEKVACEKGFPRAKGAVIDDDPQAVAKIIFEEQAKVAAPR